MNASTQSGVRTSDHDREKRFTAALSIASNALLVTSKLVVGIMINSVSVISEAMHSGMDLAASIIAFVAVKASGKPPDKLHPFGHGKAEGLSGAFEGMLIVLAIVMITYEAIRKLISGAEVEQVDAGLVVMAVSVVMNTVVSWRLFRVAKKTDSLALEADALHLSTDVFTSLGVFVGLLAIRFTGWHILDPIIALGVALMIGHAAYEIIRRSVRDLMDENLPEAELEAIQEVLVNHSQHYVEFHDLRSRKSGSKREIDLHLVQCRDTRLDDAHAICDHLEEEFAKQIPRSHITIHVEPCEVECDHEREDCRLGRANLDRHIRNQPEAVAGG